MSSVALQVAIDVCVCMWQYNSCAKQTQTNPAYILNLAILVDVVAPMWRLRPHLPLVGTNSNRQKQMHLHLRPTDILRAQATRINNIYGFVACGNVAQIGNPTSKMLHACVKVDFHEIQV